ncbi:DUF3631 domain-containing protein [Methyloceanibacter sp.]|uniref:DUF3631 domain-containing protein n=1 Tax=Methyloceanibacter sp. TaxID=1965321 RepID=UPI002C2D5711|nr:DUF3631 domain-containing protein [Methyloceanibacter sp.]HML93410.1 DUF3631 domain-containing protein [Methyloceanibacter sp.]
MIEPININGDTLLTDVHSFLERFVSYPSPEAHIAHTLWIAHAHFMDAWSETPRLAFLSPEPASGKSRALEVTELLVPRPVLSVNATPAYLFRKISDEEGLPTILFDEIDTVFGPKAKENEDLRGLLNAGHRRGATSGRCIVRGKTIETIDFPAYCAVAMAGLGNLPDTILTRSVIVRMRKRAPNEEIESFRRRLHAKQGETLCWKLARWAEETAADVTEIVNSFPELPPEIVDRDADVWEPLITVADAAGGGWPTLARVSAVTLVTELREQGDVSLGVRLLGDLREVFGDEDQRTTQHILIALQNIPEAPWGDLRGKPIDARGLSNLLKQYGVKPHTVRDGKDTAKGYRRCDLHDAWLRYLPPLPENSVTSVTPVTQSLAKVG